jgi:anti-sigma factor RsiW
MTDPFDDAGTCEVFGDDLAELALGILSGRDRIAVLEHVESCERCSAELERLSLVADALLGLAPEIEPPVGFELRLAERLQSPAEFRLGHARRHRRAGVLAVAALVLAILGFGLGAVIGPPGMNVRSPSAQANLTSAKLSSHGHVLGEVMVSSGTPAWMFMTVDAGAWSNKVTCEVTLTDGKVVTIGVFKLSNGYGAWGAPLPAPAREVRSARLVAPDGSVLASAQLTL